MRAVPADLGSRQQNLEPEMTLDLFAKALKRLTEKFFDLTAAQADDVRVLLLEAGFVVVLVAAVMHQVELIDEAAGLEHFQGAIDGHPVDLRVLLFGQLKQPLGIQMLARFIDQLEQNLALAREAYTPLFQRAFNGIEGHRGLYNSSLFSRPRSRADGRH